MPTPTVINKFRYSDVINRRYWDQNYFFTEMNVNPANVLLGGGAAAGADAETDVMIDSFNTFEYYNIAGNANIGPQLDGSFGLNLASLSASCARSAASVAAVANAVAWAACSIAAFAADSASTTRSLVSSICVTVTPPTLIIVMPPVSAANR